MTMVPNQDSMVPNAGGGASGSLSINSTPISGAHGAILWDDTGVLQEVTIGANLTFSGGTLAATSGSGIVINTTAITGGTTGRVLYDNAGTVGEAANFTIVSGQPSVALGFGYLYGGTQIMQAQPSQDNFYDGTSGNLTGTGVANTATGTGALGALSTGTNNSAIGANAGGLINSGFNNLIMGKDAGSHLTTEQYNTIFTGAINATGINNTFVAGASAMDSATGGANCVAIGVHCLEQSSGNQNTALGSFALRLNTTGSANTGVGTNALNDNTTGINNVAIGPSTGFHAQGNRNVFIGDSPGVNTVGDQNVMIGWGAGLNITTGTYNTLVGAYEGPSGPLSNNVILSDGQQNIAFQYDPTNGIFIRNNAAFLLRALTTLTAGSTANAPTLTTGPVTGNPTKWFAIDDNGTTRFVPAW